MDDQINLEDDHKPTKRLTKKISGWGKLVMVIIFIAVSIISSFLIGIDKIMDVWSQTFGSGNSNGAKVENPINNEPKPFSVDSELYDLLDCIEERVQGGAIEVSAFKQFKDLTVDDYSTKRYPRGSAIQLDQLDQFKSYKAKILRDLEEEAKRYNLTLPICGQ